MEKTPTRLLNNPMTLMALVYSILLFSLLVSSSSSAEFRLVALGNSITAGFMASSDGIKELSVNDSHLKKLLKWVTKKPKYNFVTGSKINSHCKRLQKQWGGKWECKNLAVGGSKISDVATKQLPLAVGYDPHYVVIEIGGNDICSERTTPLAEFEYYANIIGEQLSWQPDRAVVIVAIPDITSLYEIRDSKCIFGIICSKIWDITNNCPTVTSGKNLGYVRDLIRQYNYVLSDIADKYGYFYSKKTALLKFDAKYISHIDGFHPSLLGQILLSDLTYPFTEDQ